MQLYVNLLFKQKFGYSILLLARKKEANHEHA